MSAAEQAGAGDQVVVVEPPRLAEVRDVLTDAELLWPTDRRTAATLLEQAAAMLRDTALEARR